MLKNRQFCSPGSSIPQVVRTAEMMDMKVIVFVRGKVPGDAILDLARELDIVVLKTSSRCSPPAESSIRQA